MTVIYSSQSAAPQKTRRALLPLLVVLFIASYTILTLLVVEQGRTIEAQRSLLQQMLKDSTQLAMLKSKLARANSESAHSKPNAQKETDPGSAETAAPKNPSKEIKRPRKSARTMRQVPEKPAADLQDVRRSTREI